MQAETAGALYEGWQKWQRNASCRDIAETKTGYQTCPLCTLFYGRECSGCPVARETGQAMCKGTTYMQAANAKDAVLRGDAPLAAFQAPAQVYADLLERLWRAS